jgi:hypothetical protein
MNTLLSIERVDVSEFAATLKTTSHVFNSAAFAELNKGKCSEVHYLLASDSKPRFGMVLGEREEVFACPFSAPFGGIESISGSSRLEALEQCINALKNYTVARGKNLQVTLPPIVYAEDFIAHQMNCLFRAGFGVLSIDLSHYFPTSKMSRYIEIVDRSVRKNLATAERAGLSFQQVETGNEDLLLKAYSVIEENRKSKGYPLRLSFSEVIGTSEIIDIDVFTVTNADVAIASALVFRVAPRVVQVVYWGDKPGFADHRPMNFLARGVFMHYANKTDINLIDIGPSTEKSLPNYGLISFKENIGCNVSPKFTFEYANKQ